TFRFSVEHLYRTGPEPVAGQYLLWRKRGDLWKHRASVRKPDLSGAREMECVKADLEEQAENLRPPRKRGQALPDPNHPASLGERRPSWVPQLRQGDGRVRSQRRHAMRYDQPSAPVRTRLLLMRVASVHDECGAIETLVKEPHVGIDLEPLGHLAV